MYFKEKHEGLFFSHSGSISGGISVTWFKGLASFLPHRFQRVLISVRCQSALCFVKGAGVVFFFFFF